MPVICIPSLLICCNSDNAGTAREEGVRGLKFIHSSYHCESRAVISLHSYRLEGNFSRFNQVSRVRCVILTVSYALNLNPYIVYVGRHLLVCCVVHFDRLLPIFFCRDVTASIFRARRVSTYQITRHHIRKHEFLYSLP
jgi:hypothetical protein